MCRLHRNIELCYDGYTKLNSKNVRDDNIPSVKLRTVLIENNGPINERRWLCLVHQNSTELLEVMRKLEIMIDKMTTFVDISIKLLPR